MSKVVLVTGGAGYIGSHMVKMLQENGFVVCVFDNLSRGFRDAVLCEDFVRGDLLNPEDLNNVFSGREIDAVIHFAALAYVGESVIHPRMYYENNVAGSLNLLHAMRDGGVGKLVFSSTCATYGVPSRIPITEDMDQNPINPYGHSKLMIEQIMSDFAGAYGLQAVALRYFNAAGCDLDGELGEHHDPETHLIPLVLQEADRVLQGGDPAETQLCIFGDDFDTPDGTCVRDYIHVTDLCRAHLAALKLLDGKRAGGFEAFNLGNGKGFSVKDVVTACSRVTGVDIQYRMVARRQGDPAALVGSSDKAAAGLGWQPRFTELDEIVATAWRWMG